MVLAERAAHVLVKRLFDGFWPFSRRFRMWIVVFVEELAEIEILFADKDTGNGLVHARIHKL